MLLPRWRPSEEVAADPTPAIGPLPSAPISSDPGGTSSTCPPASVPDPNPDWNRSRDILAGMIRKQILSRRAFLALAGASLAQGTEPVIDIHQHTNYSGRTDEQLIAHQRTMGIAKSVLLPAGSTGGLAAGAGGNDTVVEISRRFPGEYKFFANELPDIPETKKVLEKYLKAGAIGIGEQKFQVACDSKGMQLVASIAAHYGVPVLMHFQHQTYNLGFERFHRMLEKFPKVNFIGHAQTWWGNIDKNHQQAVMYPKGPVTPGGITDRLLADYTTRTEIFPQARV